MTRLILTFFFIVFYTMISFSQNKKDTFTDPRDNQTYKTVKIGAQTWFAENLNFETENSWCYKDSAKYCEKYGRLYTYEAALEACPQGWHLPSDAEWQTMEKELGMPVTETDKPGYRGAGVGLKLKSTEGWEAFKNRQGNNNSGFNALPGGYMNSKDSNFHYAGRLGSWWTSSKVGSDKAWSRYLSFNYGKVFRKDYSINDGSSVRCVKD